MALPGSFAAASKPAAPARDFRFKLRGCFFKTRWRTAEAAAPVNRHSRERLFTASTVTNS
jgi:hypothetical protein